MQGKEPYESKSGFEVITHNAAVKENSMQASLDLTASAFRTAFRPLSVIRNFPYFSTGGAFKHS